jgi:hypothetical protein
MGVESSLAPRCQQETEINAVQTSLLVDGFQQDQRAGRTARVLATPLDYVAVQKWTWPQNITTLAMHPLAGINDRTIADARFEAVPFSLTGPQATFREGLF